MFTPQYIIDVLENSKKSMSATAISQELGYSKKNNSVVEMLEELVDAGEILKDDSGSYPLYRYKDYEDDSVDEEEETEEVDEVLHSVDFNDVCVPVDTHGWTIEETSKGFKTTSPEGNVYSITKTERILVINGVKRILVKHPEDIPAAINMYAEDMQIKNYFVRDFYLGRSVTPQSVSTNPCIIFVQVERHNKAGQK